MIAASIFALICPCHGRVPIRERDVLTQLERPGYAWTCPRCGRAATWDLGNHVMPFGERIAA